MFDDIPLIKANVSQIQDMFSDISVTKLGLPPRSAQVSIYLDQSGSINSIKPFLQPAMQVSIGIGDMIDIDGELNFYPFASTLDTSQDALTIADIAKKINFNIGGTTNTLAAVQHAIEQANKINTKKAKNAQSGIVGFFKNMFGGNKPQPVETQDEKPIKHYAIFLTDGQADKPDQLKYELRNNVPDNLFIQFVSLGDYNIARELGTITHVVNTKEVPKENINMQHLPDVLDVTLQNFLSKLLTSSACTFLSK